MIEAVVFDMDGVLVDSEQHWVKVESSFLSGVLGSWSEEDQTSILGRSIHDIYDMLCLERGLALSRSAFLSRYRSLAGDIYGVHSALIPGANEFLSVVSSSSAKIGLASGSPREWIDIVLDRFSLRPFFGAVASGDQVPGRGKPYPDIYLNISRELNVEAHNCVAIEDSAKGVQAAKAAGFLCVGLRNGFNDRQELSEADIIVSGFSELSLARLEALLRTRE